MKAAFDRIMPSVLMVINVKDCKNRWEMVEALKKISEPSRRRTVVPVSL
jgi:hypothetical protein